MSALLGLLASLLWGGADYAGGLAARRTPVAWVILGSQAAGFLLFAIAAVVVEVTVGLRVPMRAVAWGAGGGLAGVGALAAFYRALALGRMGVVAPVAAMGVAIPVVASVVGGERPSVGQAVGIIVGAIGILLASGPELSAGKAARTPVLLAGLAGIGFGVVILAVAKGSEGAVLPTLLIQRTVSVTIAGIVVMSAKPRPRPVLRDLPMLAGIGAGDGGANAAFATASVRGLVSVASVMSSLYPVVTALLAWRFSGERLRRVQVIGVAAAMVGVVLLAAG
jgi:drug/metabolite transporter (DMT)-like permease